MSRATGRIVSRVGALLLTTIAVASMLRIDAPGQGVVEAQLLVLALFLTVL